MGPGIRRSQPAATAAVPSEVEDGPLTFSKLASAHPAEDVDHYDASDQSFADRIDRPSLDDGPPARPDSS